MLRVRHAVPLLLASCLASTGCAESHRTVEDDDSGPPGDRCDRDVGPIGPPFECVSPPSPGSHVCTDVIILPGCVDGHWQCPTGLVPEPTVDCWCHAGLGMPAGCACTPTGWSCPDAGPPDAGGCPADPDRAVGTPCAPEGTTCGRCLDSCGWCNILHCTGGRWQRVEAFPPPPPCTSFECGPELRCAAEREFCAHQVSDVGGVPDDYACRPLPAGCASCGCMPEPAWCSQGPEGGITMTYPGG
jgi:hypothetical protein